MHRNITIEKEFRPDLPETATDTSQMQQVVLNILENAIDAVGKDGVIRVRSGVHAERNEIFLAISDTGHGIAKDKLDKIFDPFFTTKQIGKGTGLGLAITYGVVKMHRGSVTCLSNSDPSHGPTGTTFTVVLPRKGETSES